MRLIGTLSHEDEAMRLSAYLDKIGIAHNCEGQISASEGHLLYQLWVHDEDRIDEASAVFEAFEKNPEDPKFEAPHRPPPSPKEPLEEPPLPPKKPSRTPLTLFFIGFCTFIYFLNWVQELPMRKEGLSPQTFMMTPIQLLLFYDLPPVIEKIERIIEKHRPKPGQKIEDLSPEVQAQLKEVEKMPFWRGAYDWFLLKVKGKDAALAEGPLFYRIRQGEIWRLFTPCILHTYFFHIFFNMVWLWILGRPVEQRIGFFKTLLFTLTVGIGSNTIQYLMGGPFFLGYSGIVTGLAGFTWMRERIAPWEGYPLHRITMLFLFFFIAAMFALQLGSFLFQLFTTHTLETNIANTAHIVGALIGLLLGRLSYFSWRAR